MLKASKSSSSQLELPFRREKEKPSVRGRKTAKNNNGVLQKITEDRMAHFIDRVEGENNLRHIVDSESWLRYSLISQLDTFCYSARKLAHVRKEVLVYLVLDLAKRMFNGVDSGKVLSLENELKAREEEIKALESQILLLKENLSNKPISENDVIVDYLEYAEKHTIQVPWEITNCLEPGIYVVDVLFGDGNISAGFGNLLPSKDRDFNFLYNPYVRKFDSQVRVWEVPLLEVPNLSVPKKDTPVMVYHDFETPHKIRYFSHIEDEYDYRVIWVYANGKTSLTTNELECFNAMYVPTQYELEEFAKGL